MSLNCSLVTQEIPQALNAVAYMGMPFLDENGSVLGHLAVIDSKPLPDDPELEAVFRIFAVRASAELRRIRAESAIRESEDRFSRLFESAMDAEWSCAARSLFPVRTGQQA